MPAPEDQLIRRALAGLSIVLVGGDPRSHAIQRLKSDLGLAAVIHCPTRKTDASSRRFLSKIRAPDVALVVCARGLTRTQHGSDLHAVCRELDIPLLNCNHLPHPHMLVAALAKAHLTSAVLEHCAHLKSATDHWLGGAA